MSGAPDFVGLGLGVISDIIEAITPNFLLEPIRELRDDLLNTLLKEAIGMTKDELKDYLQNPDKYFDTVFESGAGENISLKRFNADYLKISDPGYNKPSEYFDTNVVPAAYNTAIMSNLILLSSSEINRLMNDLGSSERLNSQNVILGFIDTLDGDNQWKERMVISKDCNAYRQIFMKQAGEKTSSCSSS